MRDISLTILFQEMEKAYSQQSWKKFYKPKLEKFFNEYKDRGPIESISTYDVEMFLKKFVPNSPIHANYYNALSSFYNFAYEHSKVNNIMLEIPKPIIERKEPVYIDDNDIILIKDFISNSKNKLYDRLLLGLILYTGLPRRYLFDLQKHNIRPDAIWILDENGEHKIPISNSLKDIIKEYTEITKHVSPYSKVFKYSQDTSISSRISELTKKITGHSYTPNIIGNTFIKNALSIEPDIYSIGRIALKSVATIEKHFSSQIDNEIFERQQEIVNGI
ncbi:tyrosine-type recombinase/integrase [Konateibacter massiliensis]|uniref:tyrosine-type recombinase/integrase n=1 Tax=Konateibacter massiliensis TaxID=2002841 RepID=UPI000C14C92C|nr:hypothetical protein [Konateibacter massiliensis]